MSTTNKKSDKIFQMARGGIAPGKDIVHLNVLPRRRGAAKAHTVRGLTNSLISMSTLCNHGYIPIFEVDTMRVYDGPTTTIMVSRKAVMEGLYVPREKLWYISLVKNVSNVEHQSVAVAKLPLQIMQDGPPPLKEVGLLSLQTGSRNPCGGTNPCFVPILGPVVDRSSVRRTYLDTHVEDKIHPRQTAVQRMSLLLKILTNHSTVTAFAPL